MNSINYNEYLASCCVIARDAGKIIMNYFGGELSARKKEDHSPVTDADLAANHHIINALSVITPQIPIIAEEDEFISATQHARFWLVDPLDGTRSFVRGEEEFTVNIGLIENGKPVLGVIYAPPQNTLYYAGRNLGAWREKEKGKPEAINARTPAADGLVVVRSRSHPSKTAETFLQTLNIKENIPSSSSMKLCLLAEGTADIYPRFGRTMEWDTAAGHAILDEAGGRIEMVDGTPLTYGKPGYENPHFIAYGK
ncbi:MAG: 3'(2'),5'-bisphosphate nucleotidase CysQ [Alphaproteobacteria bacterium]